LPSLDGATGWPFPSIVELEFQYALIVGTALDAATLP
jgi:hypothetical protein